VQGTDQLLARLTALGKTEGTLKVLQLKTVREAKLIVHRKTGHLGRSIVPGTVTRDHATVEARTPYAATVELGSKPHIIRPKKAKVLAWGGTRRLSGTLATGSAPTHFARLVHHPGTKPYPYLIPAAKKALAGFKDAVVKLWNEAA
jgi:hypothetical protein